MRSEKLESCCLASLNLPHFRGKTIVVVGMPHLCNVTKPVSQYLFERIHAIVIFIRIHAIAIFIRIHSIAIF
jgi:hypothetical protein